MPRFINTKQGDNGKKNLEQEMNRHSKTKVTMDEDDNEDNDSFEDFDEIKLRLGNITSTFCDGDWKNDVTDEKGKVLVQLRKENKHLQNQNNMIQMRNEVLLDMVTTKSIKIQELEEEIEQLKSILQKSPLQRRTINK